LGAFNTELEERYWWIEVTLVGGERQTGKREKDKRKATRWRKANGGEATDKLGEKTNKGGKTGQTNIYIPIAALGGKTG